MKKLTIQDLIPGNLYSFYWKVPVEVNYVNVFLDQEGACDGGYVTQKHICVFIEYKTMKLFSALTSCLKIILPDGKISFIFVSLRAESMFCIVDRNE